MFRFTSRGAIAAACLCACALAHADDTDVDVFGPGSRSSVALFDVATNYRADEVFPPTGETLGRYAAHDNTVVLQGVYALNSRINVVGSLRSRTAGGQSFNGNNGLSYSGSVDTGTGDSLTLGGWLLGQPARPGFALAASAGSVKDPGAAARFWMQAQPQFRFTDALLLGASIGVQDVPGYGGGNSYATLTLAWRPQPRWTVAPMLGVFRYNATSLFSSFEDRELGVSLTYHLDAHWSLSAEARWVDQTDRNANALGLNDLRNGRGAGGDAGVRYSF